MRQFILENQSVKNGIIILEGKDYKYLRQVLRVKVGDMLNVRFPTGELQSTTIAQIDDKAKKITVQFCDSNENSITRGVQATEINENSSAVSYTLFQFLPKPQKLEQIVRQATECGVETIVPVVGEYTEKSSLYALEGNKKERLLKIIKEARQQSGSPVDTKLTEPMTLEQAIDFWKMKIGESECTGNGEGACAAESSAGSGGSRADSDAAVSGALAVVLSERQDGDKTLAQIVGDADNLSNVCIAVGSEGGISPEEIHQLTKNSLFKPIHFAVNILRCETAALYGIAVVQNLVTEKLNQKD